MIGYYVHHVGRGHVHRACSVAARLSERGHEVTGLSSLPRPPDWVGPWVSLALDADADAGTPALDPTARGRLHWVPRAHPGLRDRMATLAAWIGDQRPDAVVVDVSVEVALLARLHGVPVAYVVLPGHRGDPAHRLALDLADRLLCCWPPAAEGMAAGLSDANRTRLVPVGGLSRFDDRPRAPEPDRGPAPPSPRSVVVIGGAGGSALDAGLLGRARRETSPRWRWTLLGVPGGDWVEDPSGVIAAADVVITHAGQNAVAETAWARRPALVIPQARPHDEQRTTAGVLAAGPWPVEVCPSWPRDDWTARLDRVADLDGGAWSGWCDGRAAERCADAVTSLVEEGRHP